MYRAIFTGISICILLSNCSKDHTLQTTGCTNCPDTVSFQFAIIPIFKQNCAINGTCHSGSNVQNGHFDLDSAVAYAQATQVGTGYVIPGNPINSILYDELSPGVNQHMPVGIQLDDCTIQEIYCWIKQGALNN